MCAASDETLTIVPWCRAIMPGRYRAAAQNRRQHVDVEDCAIELLGDVDERVAIHEPARVVDQDVDPAKHASTLSTTRVTSPALVRSP